MKIGNLDIAVLSDGSFRLDGGALFGPVPKVLWARRMQPDRKNRVTLGLNCVLVRSPEGVVLLETGIGGKQRAFLRQRYAASAYRLLRDLKDHGVAPKDVQAVALSHLHFDHCGGCTRLDRRGAAVPTFPNARHVIQREAWEHAVRPNERSKASHFPDDFLPLEERGLLELADGETEVVPGVRVIKTGGHAAGHQIAVVQAGEERIAFLGDLVPTQHHLALPWISALDTRPEETLEQKRRLLARAEAEGWLVVFSHDTAPRAGYLERREGRLAVRPVEL